MAPKGKKGGTDEKEIGVRNVLQAVLLADSFTQSFRPISLEHPKVLIPLVNVAMIEYTLEWLAMSKVEEVRVPSCACSKCTTISKSQHACMHRQG
jgi:translation initiation factor eIF-2B subunit epsilon